MKLTQNTKLLLKNFASINQSIVIKPGNLLNTSDVSGILHAQALVEEEFPKQMDIYNLHLLLNMVSAIPDAELTPEDKQIIISGNQAEYRYLYAAPGILKSPPIRDSSFVWDEIFSTKITTDDFKSITKAVGITGINQLNIYVDSGDVYISLHDKKSAGNSFKMLIGKTDSDFNIWSKTEHLNFVPGEYRMTVCKREGKTRTVTFLLFQSDLVEYLLACDPISKV